MNEVNGGEYVYTYIYYDFKWARPITARIMSNGTNASKSKVNGG